MTALHVPRRLLTIADYEALPEDELQRWELLEGNLVMAPSPTPAHNRAVSRLAATLDEQLLATWVTVPDIDLDLQLAPEHAPATVRRPDLVVVSRDEFERAGREGGVLRASGTRLVVEVLSPGSYRTDRLIKRGEYADAGIPHYWLVDLAEPVSLIACRLAAGRYEDGGAITGVFEPTEPFPVAIDLDALE